MDTKPATSDMWIYDVDDELLQKIEELAKRDGLSVSDEATLLLGLGSETMKNSKQAARSQ